MPTPPYVEGPAETPNTETPAEYACRVHARGKYQRTIAHTGSKEKCPHHIGAISYARSLAALLQRCRKDPRIKVTETNDKFTITWRTTTP